MNNITPSNELQKKDKKCYIIFHLSFSDLQAGNPNKTGDKYSLPIELCPTADAASVEGASRLSPLTILWELEEMTQLQ